MYSLPLAIWPDALAPVLPQAAIACPTAALPMIAPPAVYGPGLDHVDVSVLPPPERYWVSTAITASALTGKHNSYLHSSLASSFAGLHKLGLSELRVTWVSGPGVLHQGRPLWVPLWPEVHCQTCQIGLIALQPAAQPPVSQDHCQHHAASSAADSGSAGSHCYGACKDGDCCHEGRWTCWLIRLLLRASGLLTFCSKWVTPGIKAVRRTADVPTLLKKVSGPECTMSLVKR